MRGNLGQNKEYCSKEGKEAFSFGACPKQGQRVDLELLATEVRDRKRSADQIAEEDPYAFHQYGRTLQKLEDIARAKTHRTWMTEGLWLYGETGSGKSHRAFEGYDPETHYVLPVRDKGWWDGYCGQETVIVNDFRGEIAYAEMLNLVDKWPHYVPRRCRIPTPFLARKLIVTSSQTPEQVYNRRDEEDSIAQLRRRFVVEHMVRLQDTATEVHRG